MLNDWFLQVARCPVTGTPLSVATAEVLQQLNRAIARGRVANLDQRAVNQALTAGLVNADSTLLYPVWQQIPVLVPAEAIPLAVILKE